MRIIIKGFVTLLSSIIVTMAGYQVFAQSPNPIKSRLISYIGAIHRGCFITESRIEQIPPRFVCDLCREAMILYDLSKDADTLLVLCDTFSQIGSTTSYVDICTEFGEYASYEKEPFNTIVKSAFVSREKWVKARFDYLLSEIRLDNYGLLSDNSTYCNPYTDYWTNLHFFLFIKKDGFFMLKYYKEMGQEIKAIYLKRLAELDVTYQ